MGSLEYPSRCLSDPPGFCLFVPKLLQSGTCFSFISSALCPEEIIIDDACFIICVTSPEKCNGGKETLLGFIIFLGLFHHRSGGVSVVIALKDQCISSRSFFSPSRTILVCVAGCTQNNRTHRNEMKQRRVCGLENM